MAHGKKRLVTTAESRQQRHPLSFLSPETTVLTLNEKMESVNIVKSYRKVLILSYSRITER